MKANYVSSFVESYVDYGKRYIINIVGGNHTTVEPGTYPLCMIGFGTEEKGYSETPVRNVVVSDEGNGSFTFIPTKYGTDNFIWI